MNCISCYQKLPIGRKYFCVECFNQTQLSHVKRFSEMQSTHIDVRELMNDKKIEVIK